MHALFVVPVLGKAKQNSTLELTDQPVKTDLGGSGQRRSKRDGNLWGWWHPRLSTKLYGKHAQHSLGEEEAAAAVEKEEEEPTVKTNISQQMLGTDLSACRTQML